MQSTRDTTCRAVMNQDAQVARVGDSIAQGLDLLLAHRLLAVPIVDHERRYRGMLLKSRLMSLLLPAAATLGDSLHPISRMPDIAFMTLGVDDLRRAFAAVADQPVEKFADITTPVFRPDSPLSSALLQLHRTRNFVPVVEEGSNRLLGVISTWDILARLRASQEAPRAAG